MGLVSGTLENCNAYTIAYSGNSPMTLHMYSFLIDLEDIWRSNSCAFCGLVANNINPDVNLSSLLIAEARMVRNH
jgi:hypothetical protein